MFQTPQRHEERRTNKKNQDRNLRAGKRVLSAGDPPHAEKVHYREGSHQRRRDHLCTAEAERPVSGAVRENGGVLFYPGEKIAEIVSESERRGGDRSGKPSHQRNPSRHESPSGTESTR